MSFNLSLFFTVLSIYFGNVEVISYPVDERRTGYEVTAENGLIFEMVIQPDEQIFSRVQILKSSGNIESDKAQINDFFIYFIPLDNIFLKGLSRIRKALDEGKDVNELDLTPSLRVPKTGTVIEDKKVKSRIFKI